MDNIKRKLPIQDSLSVNFFFFIKLTLNLTKIKCGGPDFFGHRIRVICVTKEINDEQGFEQGECVEAGAVGAE